MLWCYVQHNSDNHYNQEEAEALFKKEALASIIDVELKKLYKLASGKEIGKMEQIIGLKNEIERYFNDKDGISEKCNYLKHREMFHVKGLGQNPKKAFEKYGIKVRFNPLNGDAIDCPVKNQVHKDEVDIGILYERLYDFKNQFSILFDKLYKILIPDDYVKEKATGMNTLLKGFELPFEIE